MYSQRTRDRFGPSTLSDFVESRTRSEHVDPSDLREQVRRSEVIA